ncbi:hypothetical protein AB0J74_01685 [Asanoa sp. NPDC049573]|uniref:hypothetical protein n=1 Tax=Asanoa sp. NPDC049573 TaxID=3155396 RepID=UPI00342393FE
MTLTGLLTVTLAGTLLFHDVRTVRRRAGRWPNAAAIPVLFVAFAAAVWAGDLSTRSPNFLVSTNWLYACLAGSTVLLGAVGVLLIISRPSPEHARALRRPVR